MSFDVERYRPSALTLALAEHALPRDELLLEKEVVEARLRDLFTSLRDFELEKTNALRAHVMTTDDWSVYTEGGKQAIDTCFSSPDGEAFHIQLTCARSRELAEDPSLSDEQIIAIIRAEAVDFRVLYYAKEAMEYLNDDADPGESLLAKVRGHYTKNPALIQSRETTGNAHIFAPDPIYRFYQNGSHTVHAVPIIPVPTEALVESDITSALQSARINRVRAITEAATHAEEYRELHHQLQSSDHWPEEARQKIRTRMLEIQAINGYHGTDLFWQSVLIPADDQEDELTKDSEAWDEHAIEGLRTTLTSSAEVLVLQDKLHTRAIAAHALKILTAPESGNDETERTV